MYHPISNAYPKHTTLSLESETTTLTVSPSAAAAARFGHVQQSREQNAGLDTAALVSALVQNSTLYIVLFQAQVFAMASQRHATGLNTLPSSSSNHFSAPV